MAKWKVDITINDINADSYAEYEAHISNIIQVLSELYYYDIDVGVGEEDDKKEEL